MMRDFIKTGILVMFILLIFVIVFIILGHLKHEVSLLSRTELASNDPTVRVLYNRVKNKTDLRKAHLINENLTSDEIIKFVLDNIEQDDYEKKSYEAKKITCQVTKTIDFNTSDSKCNVAIIDNDVFMDYQMKFFNTTNELVFDDFEYKGLTCKNSGKKYYCLIEDFQDKVLGYSSLDKVYEQNDQVVLYEYYLQIDVSDNDRCLKYFDNEYCTNFDSEKRPYIDESIITKDGVLYAHIFKKNNDNYYLEQSFVVGDI